MNHEEYFTSAQKASSEAKLLAKEINELLVDNEKLDVRNLILKNTQMIIKMQESQESLAQTDKTICANVLKSIKHDKKFV